MSRRRSNRVRNAKPVTAPAPVTVTVTIIEVLDEVLRLSYGLLFEDLNVCLDDCEEDEFKSHRSCWKHIAALKKRDQKQNPTEKEFKTFKWIAPCFFEECPRRDRSPRRIKCKHLNLLRKKLCSSSFIRYIEELWRGVSDEKKTSFVYVDCLWFGMYKSDSPRIRSSVFESIKTKQIFSKKYVFLPIVYWSHWTLLIFCNFGEDLCEDKTCMLFLDSLGSTDSWKQLEPDIRRRVLSLFLFVLELFRIEGRTEEQSLIDEIPLYVPDVPQQTNDMECGSFVLYYIQRFIEDAPKNFIVDAYPYFMEEAWFSHEDLDEFCDKLNSLGTIR
ncbi:unnamed protein product [Thlaspi arvense]|uniref:Ubiquitin-like protease family profile domain-containing protein n=1 Tax=Thlaspi arvense TaxID=13288 RepID=A0AAU9SJS0_THLAR|nr:unnamed protein product [Thlaspi arvense]